MNVRTVSSRPELTLHQKTGVSNGQSGPYIFGLSFLVNVAVTFNIGEALISFDSRQYY